jgi:hypothetical protein
MLNLSCLWFLDLINNFYIFLSWIYSRISIICWIFSTIKFLVGDLAYIFIIKLTWITCLKISLYCLLLTTYWNLTNFILLCVIVMLIFIFSIFTWIYYWFCKNFLILHWVLYIYVYILNFGCCQESRFVFILHELFKQLWIFYRLHINGKAHLF